AVVAERLNPAVRIVLFRNPIVRIAGVGCGMRRVTRSALGGSAGQIIRFGFVGECLLTKRIVRISDLQDSIGESAARVSSSAPIWVGDYRDESGRWFSVVGFISQNGRVTEKIG